MFLVITYTSIIVLLFAIDYLIKKKGSTYEDFRVSAIECLKTLLASPILAFLLLLILKVDYEWNMFVASWDLVLKFLIIYEFVKMTMNCAYDQYVIIKNKTRKKESV